MENNYHFVMLCMLVLSAIFVVPNALAATYTVGDSTGWATPPIGGDPYATWASQHTFVVGDVLVFNFFGTHTVANVTKSAFDSCNTGNPLSIETNTPASFTIGTVGSHYFICTILNHCSLNQKLTITANANTNNSNNGTPSPGSPPRALSPSSPPRKSGASALAVTTTESLSLMFIFIGLLVYLN